MRPPAGHLACILRMPRPTCNHFACILPHGAFAFSVEMSECIVNNQPHAIMLDYM